MGGKRRPAPEKIDRKRWFQLYCESEGVTPADLSKVSSEESSDKEEFCDEPDSPLEVTQILKRRKSSSGSITKIQKSRESYTDPFQDEEPSTPSDSFEIIIEGMSPTATITCRLDSTLRMLELLVDNPEGTRQFRYQLVSIFKNTALIPPNDQKYSTLWRLSILLCTKIACTPYNERLLDVKAWSGLLSTLQTTLTGDSPTKEEKTCHFENINQKKKSFMGGSGRVTDEINQQHQWLQKNRLKLSELSKKVSDNIDVPGSALSKIEGEETSISLLLSCVINLIVNTDRDNLLQELETSSVEKKVQRTFKSRKSKNQITQNQPNIPKMTARFTVACPLVCWLVENSRLEPIIRLLCEHSELGYPKALKYTTPKVLFRSLHLLHLIVLFSAAFSSDCLSPILEACVRTFLSLGNNGENNKTCYDIATRCLWILVYLTPMDRVILRCEEVLLRSQGLLTKVVSILKFDFSNSSVGDNHDRRVVGLNLLANLIQRYGIPDEECKIFGSECNNFLIKYFIQLREQSETCNSSLVVSAYLSQLLCVLSRVSEKHRLQLVSDLVAYKHASIPLEKPMKLLCAVIQEFILFQSEVGVLTAEVLCRMKDLCEEVISANDLEVTKSKSKG